VQTGAPVMVNGCRTWTCYSEPAVHSDDFVALGNAFEKENREVRFGRVGEGKSRLMSQRALVDYAVQWLRRHRTSDGRPKSM
jgi:aminoglycoside 3-N-acetyltransferase